MDTPDTDFYVLERAFVALVSAMIEEGKLKPRIRNHREFASLAFPGKGEKTWKHIRIGQKGKAQALQVQDALAIAYSSENNARNWVVIRHGSCVYTP